MALEEALASHSYHLNRKRPVARHLMFTSSSTNQKSMAIQLWGTFEYLRACCTAPVPTLARTFRIRPARGGTPSHSPISTAIQAPQQLQMSSSHIVITREPTADDAPVESKETSSIQEEETNLLNALNTAFSTDGQPEAFLERAANQIEQVEAAIIDTCAKKRIRTDDNLYALLEARDAIAEETSELEKSTQTASQVTNQVNIAVSRLSEKIVVRKNLDAALVIAAQTRKLTRMYARIEDTIDSRRLYTAFRMLKVLEEETRCVRAGTVLQELVPDTHRLRAQITLHARKAFHGWLPIVRKFEHPLGAYALHHAASRALLHQHLLDCSRNSSINDAYLLPVSPVRPPISREGVFKPWTALLTPNPVPPQPFVNRRPARSPSAQRIGFAPNNSFAIETNVRPDIGGDARRSFRTLVSDHKEDVPMLYLRPLLQGIMVHEGLGLLGDLRAVYHQERYSHFQRLLEECDRIKEGVPTSDEATQPTLANTKSRLVETIASKICGFFVVERAVEMHASSEIVARTVVDKEWWMLAKVRLNALFDEINSNGLESPGEKGRVRSIEENVGRFAHVNELG